MGKNASAFTRTSNWTELKNHHARVHGEVQEYINLNANKASNNDLITVSKNIELSTKSVFKCLDIVKVDYCKSAPKSNAVPKVEKVLASHTTAKKEEVKLSKPSLAPKKEPYKPKTDSVISSKASKTNVITANNNDDDEWESF